MADMEDELKEKQQLVAQLEAEQQRLSRKAHALEAVVGGSESTQELLMQQLSELAVSEDSDLSGYSQHPGSSISRSSSASTSASSHVQSGADQGQDIDPEVIELAEQYTHYVQQARPLLQELDAGRGGAAGTSALWSHQACTHNALLCKPAWTHVIACARPLVDACRVSDMHAAMYACQGLQRASRWSSLWRNCMSISTGR